jgi:hypothetical protein
MRRLIPATSGGRAALAVVAFVLALNLVIVLIEALVPSPSGPESSAFATQERGLAAWAELARRSGRDVRLARRPPADAPPPAGATAVVLDPEDLPARDVAALRELAEAGGRVIAGGRRPGAWLEQLAGPGAPEWEREAAESARAAPAPLTARVERIRSAGEGGWERAGRALPLVVADGRPTFLLAAAGSGSILLVADASPLQNRLLARDDNAALALALAGDGPLVFVESAHGYGPASGLAALPARLQWGLALLGLSALLLIAARWRRLGPPQPPDRPLPPPRRAYVDALAATLARTPDRAAAVAAVRSAARDRLARRAAVPAGAPADAWRAAARASGLDDEQARALTDPDSDPDGIAAGRALARLAGEVAR